MIDDTLGEHGGSLVDHGARHDNHGAGTSPLAHHPVTRCYVSGPVRFPLDLRLYRRNEALIQWAAAVAKHFPALKMPTETQARNRRQQQVDPVLRPEAGFRTRPAQVHPTIVRAIALGEAAIRHNVPVGVVVFAAGSRAEDMVRGLARRRKAGISLLPQDRLRETARFHLRDANGWPLQLPRPHIAVEELVPLLPTKAYRPVNAHEPADGCFTLTVRLPGLGKVRRVVSFAQESLTGRSGVLGTNRVDWSAAKIIGLYLQRWPTETLEQDGQGPLGLDADRMRSTEAMGQHWCLVFVASSLLPLTCLPAGPERPQGLLQTRGEACRQQGRALIHKLLLFVHDQ